MQEITLPYKWRPRHYQVPMWKAFERGCLRAFLVWHRRAGKDDNNLHYTAGAAMMKPATYWYMLPQQNQVRRSMWDAVNPHTGKRRINEAFPDVICKGKRSNDMVIELLNGSMVHFLGSDGFDALVGSPPYGLVFSEYALTNPLAWSYLMPILDENGGWAIFNMTPRGRNHAFQMYNYVKNNPKWFVQVCLPSDTGAIPSDRLEEARNTLYAIHGPEDGEVIFQQEYWCSFDAGLVGSYYGSYIDNLEKSGRITTVPHDPLLPVHTAWDLGMDDATGIWFYQTAHGMIRLIDYVEDRRNALEYYVQNILSRGWTYGGHDLPHDVQVQEMGTGKTRLEMLHSLGLHDAAPITRQNLPDGINAVRSILPRCWFDKDKCARGIEALRMYRREYDEVNKVFKDRPVHDWSSHGADSFRYLALGLDESGPEQEYTMRYENLRVC